MRRARRYTDLNGFKSVLLLGEKTPSGVTEEKPRMLPRSRYRDLLDDDVFSAWIETVSRGSKVNAGVYLRRIVRICKLFEITQRDLVKMSRGEARGLSLPRRLAPREGGEQELQHSGLHI